jgi:hypothetical protein
MYTKRFVLLMILSLAGMAGIVGIHAESVRNESPMYLANADVAASDAGEPAKGTEKNSAVTEEEPVVELVVEKPKTPEGTVAVWATVIGTVILFVYIFYKSSKLDADT